MRAQNIEDVYPLSSLQEGLLFHTLSDPGSGVYVVQLACELGGDFDATAFRQAWSKLLARHAILRTAFIWEGLERPVQVVCRELELPITEHDWRDLSPAKREAELDTLLAADRRRGFELSQAPLTRLILCRTGERSHRMIWTHHHLLLDGWSLQLLLREVFALYEACRQGEDLDSPPAPAYRSYIAWLGSRNLTQAESFWRRELAGFSAPTPLPADVPPRRRQVSGHGAREIRLSATVSEALEALVQRQKITLNTLLQGLWAWILSRASGEADVVFGFISAGRPPALPGAERMVGLFLNTLPVRVHVASRARLIPWLQELQESQVRLREFDYSPLAQVQGWSEVQRGVDLFHSLLDFAHYGPESSLSDLETPLEITDVRFAERPNYPLAIIAGLSGALSLRMLYRTAQLDRVTVTRIQGYFVRLLRAVAENPDRRLGDLPWLSRGERSQLLREWNDTAAPLPGGSMQDLFEARLRQDPQAVAVLFGGRSYTYSEVDEWASRLTHQLRDCGVQRGDLVAVYLERCWEMIPVLLGILRTGAAYVPLDAGYPESRVQWILSSLGIRWLVSQAALLETRPEALAQVAELEHILTVDAPWQPAAARGAERSGDAIGPRHSTWLAEVAAQPDSRAVDCGPQDLAYIIFTSGSTGTPKGVMERHGPVVNLIRWVNETFDVSPSDRMLFITSLCFDLSVYDIFGILAAGGSVRVATAEETADPTRLVEILCEEPVTFWDSAPAALQQLTPLLPARASQSSLRLVFLSGDWIPVSLPDRIRGVFENARLIALGGATEATVWSNFFPIPEVDPAWPSIPYGRPMRNARYHVLDEALSPCPVGVAGDLFIAGHCLTAGYAGAPTLSGWKLVPDSFGERPGGRMYRTGDRARFWPDGVLEFLGRLDHQVKIRGFRIELGEIEVNLSEHAGVDQVAVVVRENESGHKRLVAYVVSQAENPAPVDDLREYLAKRLPEYMLPSSFVFLDAMPVTANGKLDRKALPAPFAESAEGDFEPPRGEREQHLAALWAEVLRCERVGRQDNFFELGGDSILSIQIVSRANQLGIKLTPGQLFEHQTIAELAAVAGEAVSEAEQGTIRGALPLTPVQRWFFEQDMPEAHHFNQSLLLAGEALEDACLHAALSHLLAHHDALRLRFRQREDGWEQRIGKLAEEPPFSVIDLENLGSESLASTRADNLDAVQASLGLTHGSALRMVLIRATVEDRLLLVFHHLLIDGVSWRILLEDLHTAYEQLRRQDTVALPAKTTSYKRWAEGLEEIAAAGALADDVDYWSAVPPQRPGRLPIDHPAGSDLARYSDTVSVTLEAPETTSLLTQATEAYHTQISDLLLTALVETFAAWTGERGLLLQLEGHGREDLVADLDLSRTVGWFTSIFPVWLDPGESEDPGQRIKVIKESLRRIPRRGASYGPLRYLGSDESRRTLAGLPQPQIGFNYLGQLDSAVPSGLRPAAESAGADRSPHQPRRLLIEISAHVHDAQLRIAWTYSREQYDPATVHSLATRYLSRLSGLIEHCCSPQAGGWTPADFPLAALDQAGLDRLVGTDRDVADIYPLSPLQQGMLFHSLHDPRSGVYCQQLSCLLEGPLEAATLLDAWQAAVDRHPILRTAFAWEELDEPLQIVYQAGRLPVKQRDWHALAGAEQQQRLDELLESDRQRGFDYERAPLMRLQLIRLSDDRHRLIWTHHHLLLDGWSIPILIGQIFATYQARIEGQPTPQTPPAPPFRDFIAWLATRDHAEAESFWRRQLAGFTTPNPVADATPNASRRFGDRDFGRESRELSSVATAALEGLARQEQLTLNTILSGVWGLLLARYSDCSESVFGMVTAGRPTDLEGAEAIVGPFLNTVPLRLRSPGAIPVAEWLKEVQQTQVAVRAYEFTPLRDIQEWSDVARGTPLFESLVIFENYPVGEALAENEANVRVRDVAFEERTNYPLALVGVPGARLKLEIVFDSAVLDRPFVARALRHVDRLLAGFAATPRARLAEVAMLTPAERQLLLGEWNDTERAAGDPGGLHQLFEDQVRRTPQALAIEGDGRRLSFRELDRLADDIAARLTDLGVTIDDPVALLSRRSPEMIAAILGVLKAGGAFLPLDSEAPSDRLRFILADAGARVLIGDDLLADRLPAPSIPVLHLAADEPPQQPKPAGDRFTSAQQLAWILFTSGSTGRPKGVMISHRAAVNYMRYAVAEYRASEGNGSILHSPISFDLTMTSLFAPLLAGHPVRLLPDGAHPRALADALVAHDDLSLTKLTPSHLGLINASLGDDQWADRTRCIVLGGESLSAATIQPWLSRAPGTRIINEYGPTEATVGCAVFEAQASSRAQPAETVPIGRPIPGLQLLVLDSRLQPTPLGVPGELFIAGKGLARGDRRRPGLTACRFLPHLLTHRPGERLYRSGDRTRWLDDGNLDFLGRIDEQIKLRGYRIEPAEIEAALAAHPRVREAAVVLRQDSGSPPRLVAYAVADGELPGHRELRDAMRDRLPDFMLPSQFVGLDRLPLTANGKIDRRALPAPDHDRPEIGHFVAPQTSFEQGIAAIWVELLGIERIGVHDNFFELGGDSLVAMRLSSKLQVAFEVEVPLERLFESPTVGEIAQFIEHSQLELAASADEQELADLLAEIEGLSDEGAGVLLGSGGHASEPEGSA
ncbi:MAG: amino acid adenylation domain-containing protein [Acidobacteriota bacterium]